MRKPVRLMRSAMTGAIYAVTKYDEGPNGGITAKEKWDVSADFVDIVAQRDGLAAPRATPEDTERVVYKVQCQHCARMTHVSGIAADVLAEHHAHCSAAAPRARDWEKEKGEAVRRILDANNAYSPNDTEEGDPRERHRLYVNSLHATVDALCDAVARHAGDGEDSKRIDNLERLVRERWEVCLAFNVDDERGGDVFTVVNNQAVEDFGVGSALRGAIDAAMRLPVSPTEEPTNG